MPIERTEEKTTVEKAVSAPDVQKSNCRFQASRAKDGKPTIRLELFQPTVSSLAGVTIEFELMGGTTSGESKALADAVNDRIIAIVLTQS
jgi:hypothetical protein